jgi:hypothetical protein
MTVAIRFLEIMHQSEENVTFGSVLFADNNIAKLSLENADDINPLLNISN